LSCGYTGKMSADMKSKIIRAIVLHSTMRVVPMLDWLRKGLQLYDLRKVMEMHPDLCLPLFVPGGKDDKVDAAFILENCHPVFSDKGSAKYTKEVNVMNFFQDFLQEVEDCGEAEQMTAGKVMQWMTGQRHKPILPSDQKDFNITVKFNHNSDTNHTVCFPTVSACTRTITFPTAHLKTLN
uniref:HECT domain-containing protein n=1 Tax=Sinocyclocheilus rhinocerous TaxID=307959 RepID=A0A673N3L5_9TELE